MEPLSYTLLCEMDKTGLPVHPNSGSQPFPTATHFVIALKPSRDPLRDPQERHATHYTTVKYYDVVLTQFWIATRGLRTTDLNSACLGKAVLRRRKKKS